MLTLSQSLHIDSASVFRDFVVTENGPSFTNTFYVVPDLPRWVVDGQGEAAFDLTWYKSSSPIDVTKGAGIVTMAVDLSLQADERAAMLQRIASQFGLAPGAIQLLSIPFKTGTVELSIAGESKESKDTDFVNQIAGGGPAQLNGSEQAAFTIDVKPEGAALLWQALEKRLDVFHLRYDLVFDHRLMGTRMRVWCDAKKTHSAASQWLQSGGRDPRQLRDELISQRLAGIDLDTDQPLANTESAALQKCGQDVLDHALASTLFGGKSAPAKTGETLALRPYSDSLESTLNFTLTESYPLEQHLVIDSVMHLDLTPEQFARQARMVEARDGFFDVLDLQIACTVDFTTDLISTVTVHIEYDATGPSGRIQRSGDYIFNKSSASIQRFRTDIASPSQTSFRYSADIYYHGDPTPLHIDYPEAQGTAIVLGLDAVGILSVRAELRDVPFDDVSSAVVDLRHSPSGATSRLIMDGKNMSGVWNAVVRQQAASFEYKVAWILKDGRRLEREWISSSQHTLFLDAPAELKTKAQVSVIAAGDFTELTKILVDLRDPHAPEASTQFVFTQSGQTRLWEPHRGQEPTFAYEYRRTLVYQDGTVRALDTEWAQETRPVLVIRDDFSFEVHLVCRLLDLGGSLKMAIVELEPEEPVNGLPSKKTIVVRNKNEEPRWSFRLQNKDEHRYRYRLSEITATGEHRPSSAWQHAESDLLVLTAVHS
ncbi:MAG TPA: hypothetical protein VKE93_07015 [Candidatus Angelobacter sp.]|nr:hypothetical protein [Candidatus Angelobacter sp.]